MNGSNLKLLWKSTLISGNQDDFGTSISPMPQYHEKLNISVYLIQNKTKGILNSKICDFITCDN